MKNIKRVIILLLFVVVTSGVCFAQPPHPTQYPERTTSSIFRHRQAEPPIGTATGLLFALSATTLAYKIRKNRK